MENTDSYLHKKFKKQVTIDTKTQNDKENKIVQSAETKKEEKTVPIESTNPAPIESSISTEEPSNSYISNVISKQFDHQTNQTNFDTKFKQQTNFNSNFSNTSSSSSNPNVLYQQQNISNEFQPYSNEIQHNLIDKSANGKYVCPYCNLICSKPSVLQKHIRAHTNERPYPCQSCGFSFKTRSNLYKHCRSRTHANRLIGTNNNINNNNNKKEEETNLTQLNINNKPYKPRFHSNSDIIINNNSNSVNNNTTNEFVTHQINEIINSNNNVSNSKDLDEPLNLTLNNKNRKRSLSEVTETVPKSLIKELLLKNLSSDNMQCPYCKMIFQTVTELDVHKYKSCKGKVNNAKYTRSSSVNVASILTHNKNAFDHLPVINSPGPFLGKTRLIDKSFSFDTLATHQITNDLHNKNIKLFGGEVKEVLIQNNNANNKKTEDDYNVKLLSENRVVKTSLHSGGTVLTNHKADNQEIVVIDHKITENNVYKDIQDFSQKAIRMLTPNIKPPVFNDLKNPLNLYINGKVIRHVPGMPNPHITENEFQQQPVITTKTNTVNIITNSINCITSSNSTSTTTTSSSKKFTRPTSLALKPTVAALKQHHGLTPTMFNQILISPDTPRVAKKYTQHSLHGNYFSYLGLKSSTRSVYCTLNKTQPFYVPFFKKLSMYSEWRQQDTKQDKMYASCYDSRQKGGKCCVSVAGRRTDGLVIHSSYKFIVSETSSQSEKDEQTQKSNQILGGYESNDDYVYVRGRGRGRYVCDQCGIRCKKPSMLKKHIRTHSNDRPYACMHCNFSFKTKGNLTKHMKSKAHSKNSTTNSNGSSSSSAQQSAQSSGESDTEDSGMDSSDESTRQQEHEAAYGLLSLSQKPTQSSEDSFVITTEEIAHVSQTNYAKNKILDERNNIRIKCTQSDVKATPETWENQNVKTYLGMGSICRPLTYPYTSILPVEKDVIQDSDDNDGDSCNSKSIKQFHVIQKYANHNQNKVTDVQVTSNTLINSPIPTLKINDIDVNTITDLRKRKISVSEPIVSSKLLRNDQVIDLSITNNGSVINNSLKSLQINEDKDDEVVVSKEVSNGEIYDKSAMETLADIATKQVKLEKNTLAKSVASEFLKLATKNDTDAVVNKDVAEIIVKSEGNKSCNICLKSFNKPSQLKLHMNIHYLERPFRCDSCSVSFRTKGHLQKHERSASHHNKLSSSPALSSSEPRPFKCSDCSIAFRIHGHLAKHLRSKMHIQKLECLAKIPFGLYAELERSNSLLTEINTSDGDQCLQSLKTLAKKVFINDPNKLNQLEPTRDVAISAD